MKKKDNKKIKFKLGNNLILWILIVLGSYYVVQLIPDTLSNTEVGYNDYRNHLENGEISQISYGQDKKITFWINNDQTRKYWTGLDESEKSDSTGESNNSIEIKIKEINNLLEKGLITQKEYDSKKQSILDSI